MCTPQPFLGVHSDPATSACLRGRIACDASSACDEPLNRSCLTAHIPAWGGVTLDRVSCCLRCCLRQWIHRLGLEANAQHWRDRGVDFSVSDGRGGVRADGDAQLQLRAAQPVDSVLNLRFSIARFADFQAVERRDWQCLANGCEGVEAPRFRAASRRRSGSLVVLNGWGWSRAKYIRVLASVDRAMPDGPLGVYFGDDWSWNVSGLARFDAPFTKLACHFAMNLDDDAASLPTARQVPIGLNAGWAPLLGAGSAAAVDMSAVLRAHGRLPGTVSHRTKQLHCCCQRSWTHRRRAYEGLFAAGHQHCTRSALERTGATDSLVAQYLNHKFVAAPHGNGNTDFRVWEVLMAGSVPVVDHFPAHDWLYDGLPIVRVKDWSAVTPGFLGEEWERIQRGVKAGRLGWAKAYFPFWFGTFTAHLSPVNTWPGEKSGPQARVSRV